jgi:type II secretory pathway pseudopilin PulG
MMKKSKPQPGGFILIEVIVSIVLLGILGVFTTMFLYTGIKGYMISKQTADGAMRVQVALDRMNLELRKVTSVPAATSTSITYTTNDLPGTRRIFYDTSDPDNHTISIEVDEGTPYSYALLDDIKPESFSITLADTRDLDNDGNNEIEGIDISFTLTDIGRPFNLRVYPRNWIDPPP